MFEAGEQAAVDIKFDRIEDSWKEFEKDAIIISIEKSEKKVLFRVKGLDIDKKCKYCDLLRGFFGGLARKHFDQRYYCRKGTECIFEGSPECTFVAEMVE